MKGILVTVALLLFASLLQAQNTGSGMPAFGSFTSGGFDTISNQNLNVLFSIPLVSSPGRGMPLNLSLTYNSLIYQNYQNIWLPAVPNGSWGWLTPTTGFVTYTSTTSSTKCGTGWAPQTRYYNYAFVDLLGTAHPVPSISMVYYHCNGAWSGTFTGTTSDSSGYYLNATPAVRPLAVVTAPNGATSLNPVYTMADTNGNYITATSVGSSETDWTDSVGQKAAKVIYNPNFSTPTSVQVEFLDGSGNYQTITLKYQAYSIKTNFACSGVTEYTGTAYLPYELDIPSPVSGTLTYKFTYEQTPGLSGYYSGRLQQVTLPTGGYYEYTYTGANDSINCSDGTTLSMNRIASDGSNSATWTFARNTSNSTTTVTTPQLVDTPNSNATVYTFNSVGHETYRKIYATTTTTGTPLRSIQTYWATNGTPSAVVTTLEDGVTQGEVDTAYDSNGLLDSVIERDWGGGTIRSTYYTYQTSPNYTSRNILNLVIEKQIKDGNGTIQFRQDTAYDGPTITNCPTSVPQHDDADYPCSMNYRGNPTSVTTYTAPSVPSGGITKNFTYDVFGNLLTAQLDCCQTKTWTYSTSTEYSQPDSVTIGTSPTLTTSYLYNLYLGLVTKTTDPNNLVINYSYDFLRRPTQVAQVNGATNGESVSYSYNDTAFTTTTTTTLDSSKSVKQIITVDGLGRINTSTTEDASNNVYSVVAANYDLVGRAYKTSNPYTGSPSYWTTTSYDVLGRPATVALQDSSAASYSYAEQYSTVTDPAGRQRKSQSDGVGRLAAVFEPDATNGWNLTQQTSYTYNVLDELTTVTQGSQTRSYAYDALGRLLSVTTPESGKTCFGTVTGGTCNANGYDNFDNLLYRTDARGVLTSYGYDGLNRLSGITYTTSGTTAQPTASLSFAYGTNASEFNNGLLITMTDGVGSESYSYNALEQRIQLQKIVGTTTYTTGYAYNVSGELTQITYPSGRVLQQSVDPIGRLCEVAPSTTGCGTATSPYTTGYGYSASNQPTGFKYGNGIYASMGFSPDRLQLYCLDYSTTNRNGTCAHDSTTKFGLTYAYGTAPNNNGQIARVADSIDNGRTIAYTYDPLYRISNATTVGSANYPQWGLSWSYDRYGNISSQNSTAGSPPSYSLSVNGSSNQITASGFAYDANGNMTNDGLDLNTITYDAENRAASSTNGSSSGTYTYDGHGYRVEKVSGGTTTIYIFSGSKVIAEYTNGAAPSSPSKEYIYAGSRLIANFASGITTYFQQDHLSNRILTDVNGNVVDQHGHYPFGEQWYVAGFTKWEFSTYERDAESGNDYATTRTYINRLSRFSSTDPISGDVSDPQTIGRYVYTRNDPVNFHDPSGKNLSRFGDGGCDEENCAGGAGVPGAGGGFGENDFCDASGACTGGTGVNGVPWSFGPGYVMQLNSPLAQLLTAQAQYVARVNYTIEANWLGAGFIVQRGPGGVYYNPYLAGAAAVSLYGGGQSDPDDPGVRYELGGTVYMNSDGTFGYTSATVVGPPCPASAGSCMSDTATWVPFGDQEVGDWHVHPWGNGSIGGPITTTAQVGDLTITNTSWVGDLAGPSVYPTFVSQPVSNALAVFVLGPGAPRSACQLSGPAPKLAGFSGISSCF